MRLAWTTVRILSAAILFVAGCQAPPAVPAATTAPTAASKPAAQPTTAAAPAAQPTNTPAPQAAPKPGGQLVYAVVGSDVRILNPILQSDTVSGGITDRLFEPLVNEDPKTGAPIGILAESWTVSPDGLT